MSNIRVTYTGLISFIGGLIGLVTGSIFSLIITRTLTPEDYGYWGLIFSVVSYFPMILSVFSYWATRETARKLDSGKTAVLSTLFFSMIASIIFIIISFFIISQIGSNQIEFNQNNFLLATVLIPPMFLAGIFSSIALGYKPHVISFSTISFGIVQILSALFFIYFLDMGIPGIILTLMMSYIASALVLFFYVHEKIRTSFKKEFLKKWLKLFWIPIYPTTYLILTQSSILIFTVITDSIVGVAYWVASIVMVSVISSTGLISRAVYPKLLENKETHFFQDNLTYLFYFAILFTSLVISFARSGLFLLNPFYEVATPIVMILSIEGFLVVLINMFQNSLIGIERVDINTQSTYKDYIKSKLFYVHTLRLIQTVSYVTILIIVLVILTPSVSSEIELLTYWASIALITQIPLVTVLTILIKRNFSNPFDIKRIMKFCIVGVVTSTFSYLLTEQFLTYTPNVFEFIPNLLLFVMFGIGIYCVVTYFIDSKIRILFNSIIYGIKNKN